jgi:phosphohistidine phosphatase
VVDAIGPAATALDLLKVCDWPNGNRAVLMVCHQPALGHLASLLLTGQEAPWTIRKGAVWWLRSRQGGDSARAQTLLLCVQSPDTM